MRTEVDFIFDRCNKRWRESGKCQHALHGSRHDDHCNHADMTALTQSEKIYILNRAVLKRGLLQRRAAGLLQRCMAAAASEEDVQKLCHVKYTYVHVNQTS